MTVSIESFLVLEKSLSNRLLNAWRRDAASATRQIVELVQAGDFVAAVDLCEGLGMGEAAEENRRFAEFIGMQAALFGASRISGDPRKSVFMESGRPKEIKLAANNLIIMMEENATQSVCRLAITMLGQEQVDQQEATIQKDATPKFPREFVSSIGKNGKGFIDIGSSLHTSRLASWGFTIEATARGIESFQINEQLDGRTCPVCRTMHGRKFNVAQARAKLETWMSTTNPDDMKSVAPWPKQDQKNVAALSQMSSSQIQDRGWDTPPFHPLCRGVLVRSGSVAVVEPAKQTPINENVLPRDDVIAASPDKLEDIGAFDVTVSESNELGRVPDVFKSVTSESDETLFKALDKISDDISIEVGSDIQMTSHYDPSRKSIVINKRHSDISSLGARSTYRHEIGHAIDNIAADEDFLWASRDFLDGRGILDEAAEKLITKKGLHQAVLRDFRRLNTTGKTNFIESQFSKAGIDLGDFRKISGNVAMEQELAVSIASGDIAPFLELALRTPKKGWGHLNDFFGSMTKNEVGAGHALSYYKNVGYQTTEMFANYIAARGATNKAQLQILEWFSKEVTDTFDEILKLFAGTA